MADNTMGSGYLDNAKPFNVINPTGIDPGQSVDILKEVSENARNRAFQASENEKDRAVKQQQFGMEMQSREKDRASSDKLARDQMAQQQGQFDVGQANAQLQHQQELELERQKMATEERDRARSRKIQLYQEQAAQDALELNMKRARLLDGRGQFGGGDNVVEVPGAAPHSLDGTPPKPVSGNLLNTYGSVFSESENQQFEKEYEAMYAREKDLNERLASLELLKKLSEGWGDTTNKDPNGQSAAAMTLRRYKEHQEARLSHVAKVDPLLRNALVNAFTERKFVDPNPPTSVIENLFQKFNKLGRDTGDVGDIPLHMPPIREKPLTQKELDEMSSWWGGYNDPNMLPGDTEAERQESYKWMAAGMLPPPTLRDRINTLADTATQVVAGDDKPAVNALLRTLFANLVDAGGLSGTEREGCMKLARAVYSQLEKTTDPEMLDHALYMLYQGVSGADADANKLWKEANQNDPVIAGESEEARKIRLTAAEKQRAGFAASADAVRLKNGLKLLRDSVVDGVDHRTGEPSTERVQMVKHWGVLANPVEQAQQANRIIVKAVTALMGTDDPATVLDYLTDNDPSNDTGGDEVRSLFKAMDPELKQVLRESFEEHRSAMVALAQQHHLDVKGLNAGDIREMIAATQGEIDKNKFEQNSKVRKLGDQRIKENKQKFHAVEDEFLGKRRKAVDDLSKVLGD